MSTFTVDGVDGITFTAALDPNEANWLLIEGYNRAGELVTRTGIAVTPDPIEDVALTPEIVTSPTAADRDAAAEYIESLAPDDPPQVDNSIVGDEHDGHQ